MDRRGAFDYILLETTGLADPGNLAPLFWVDEGLGSTIYLDGIVTLVDAKNILKSLNEPIPSEIPSETPNQNKSHASADSTSNEDHEHSGPHLTTAHLQISHADVLILNKSDLVTPEELTIVKERITAINGLAKLHITEFGATPQLEGVLLDLHAYDRVDFNLDEVKAKGHSHLDPVSFNFSLSSSSSSSSSSSFLFPTSSIFTHLFKHSKSNPISSQLIPSPSPETQKPKPKLTPPPPKKTITTLTLTTPPLPPTKRPPPRRLAALPPLGLAHSILHLLSLPRNPPSQSPSPPHKPHHKNHSSRARSLRDPRRRISPNHACNHNSTPHQRNGIRSPQRGKNRFDRKEH
ncbi:hypothetical protein BcDW1_9440 [Botrytis cinerea BcDW1]|uniref:CobW/HypB/UreG nucleotide-binding domain-containing protein n=1 Tax=Botryotinia fuckeliana (strain BcDW1) TaxID=1290391 RepID=M7TLH5_BOTF1|nr:hypothetical protein BcDW1_9440 [Botrytis cinerea BcDW1]